MLLLLQQEYYADYIAIDDNCFHLDVETVVPLLSNYWDHRSMDRTCEGILSCLLSMKKRPFIRYQRNSEMCRRIAQEVAVRMDQERNLFDFRSSPTLLIMDRRDDPITPLLTQWTYQAMIHELLGIKDNTVTINDSSLSRDGSQKPTQLVFSAMTDDFYSNNMYQNWGDLVSNIARMVDNYKKKSNVKENIQSIGSCAPPLFRVVHLFSDIQ